MKNLLMSGAAMLVASGACADISKDAHLDALPRTEAEAALIRALTAPSDDFAGAEDYEGRPGGATTALAREAHDAFVQPAANLPFDRHMHFDEGDELFEEHWQADDPGADFAGLGPLFNARSCDSCHVSDGRGHPPAADQISEAMFLRVSRMGGEALKAADGQAIEGYIATSADPAYGGQLQNFAHGNLSPEGQMQIDYSDLPVTLGDGTVVTLRAPAYSITQYAFGALADDMMLSPRVAQQMIGLGLLEAIPAADILAHADPEDADGDGISGRPNIAWSVEFRQPMLGRFGHKAGSPTVRQQSAEAFSGDMGLSTSLFPNHGGDCQDPLQGCLINASQTAPEVSDERLDAVAFYSRNLAVPARRDHEDPQVLAGKQLFYQANCQSCHVPKFVTARLADNAEQSFQLIWPHTDLLLHDMGDGLADNRPEHRADGHEWRTAPLWGIGLTEDVSGQITLLHDGRARNVEEAVLWHGGEAQASRDAYAAMSAEDRAALIRFVESL